MKVFKILSLALCFGLLSFSAQAEISAEMEDPMSLSSSSVFVDQITAEKLGLSEDEVKIPGESGYLWNKFKLSTKTFFTFDASKKADLEVKRANLELLAAKKAIETDADGNEGFFNKALAKYNKRMATAEKRIQKLPEDQKATALEKIDTQNLKHQQLLRDLTEKLPEQVKEKVTAIRKERVESWYKNHKDNLEARLEAAAKNEDGGRFGNLQIMSTLEELNESLPVEAQAKIQAVIVNTQNRLSEKLKNLNTTDKEKLEQYIKDINLDEIKKVQLINHLDKTNISADLRYRIQNIKNENINNLEKKFKNLEDDEKNSFLKKHFETGQNGESTKIEMLNRLEQSASSELKVKIRNLNEKQELRIKERVRNTSNQAELDRIEAETIELPVIRREIQERRGLIGEEPSTSNRH